MRRQPDFAGLFRKYFETGPAKVAYGVRRDSNRIHDVVFLGSLIHDARFRRSDVVLRSKRLVIPMDRDRWELGIDTKTGLYAVQSRLTVSPVTEIKWSFAHGWDFRPEDELMIEDIWISRQAVLRGDFVSVVLSGFTWECVLTVHETEMVLRLEDCKR
jgi:hypothetical protein